MPLVVLFALLAQTDTTDALARARALRDEFELERALTAIAEGLAAQPSTSEAMGLLELEADIRIARNEPQEARRAYLDLLNRVPSYSTPRYLSPKARAALDDARAAYRSSHPDVVTPVMTGDRQTTSPPGHALTSRPWFWAALAGGVAIVATSIVLITTHDGSPDGDHGPYIVR